MVRAVEVHGTLTTPGVLAVGADTDTCRQDERHSYEKCQYVEFKKRVAKMDELREAKGPGWRSN